MTLRTRWLCALALLPITLTGCSGLAPVNTSVPQLAAATQSQIDAYNFEVNAGFQIASVDEGDQATIDSVRQNFEQDLRKGNTDAYLRDKNFSIHLLSGSEGNYFTSPEFLQNSLSNVLATLVVMDVNQNAQIFKGQYENSRFVFADPADQFELSTRTKAYLLTADANFQVQTYKGELVPDSEVELNENSGSTATSSSNESGSVTESTAATEAIPTTSGAFTNAYGHPAYNSGTAGLYTAPGHAYPPMMNYQMPGNYGPVNAGFKAYPAQPYTQSYNGVMMDPGMMGAMARPDAYDPFAGDAFQRKEALARAEQGALNRAYPKTDASKTYPAKATPTVKAKPVYTKVIASDETLPRRSRVTLTPVQP